MAARFAFAFAATVAATLLWRRYAVRRVGRRRGCRPVARGALDLIGDTPMIELRSLSRQTGCRVLAKAEFLNPGGSSKDRVAAAIIREAEASGALREGGTVVEATAGSTGARLTSPFFRLGRLGGSGNNRE